MPNRKPKLGSDIQPSLFASGTVTPGSDNLGPIVRGCITRTCRESRLSREQIAERMTEFLGVRVSERMLFDWTADSKELHRFPLEFVLAFCRATDDWTLLSAVVERCGVRVISEQEAKLIDFARISVQREQSEREFQKCFADLVRV